MEILVFAVGCIVGCITMWAITNFYRTCHGWFNVEPYSADDPGFYNIRVTIGTDPKIPNATRIILHRSETQK